MARAALVLQLFFGIEHPVVARRHQYLDRALDGVGRLQRRAKPVDQLRARSDDRKRIVETRVEEAAEFRDDAEFSSISLEEK